MTTGSMVKANQGTADATPKAGYRAYQITITETLSRQVEVEAESREEAVRQVRRIYNNGEIVLGWDDLTDTQITMDQNGNEP